MLYFTIFAAIALFATVSNSLPTKSKMNEPERCCVSNLFSAQISTSSGVKLPDGTTFNTYGYYNFSYDANRGFVGMKGVSFSVPEQQKSNLWIIENMKSGQIYTFDEDSKKCYKSINPIKSYSCIPGMKFVSHQLLASFLLFFNAYITSHCSAFVTDSATYLHSFTYGYGDKQIIADTWLIQIDNAVNYATVSRDGLCVPLTGNNFVSEPAMINAITTTDYVPKVDDPSIFDIPAECNTVV
ncbi:unnamed protein product [Rotaria magnacalcarata]|uniref:Ependymin-related protein n=1 Tax=Rotaria magnacalcarata TaxID=392030 RepID=A0A820UVG8_9BILA|nr:unnamed protein product [Rotaria magnacalcarata]CAF4490952.1 unnamed protein product [Rotaria magnacalcarata]CAF4783255.1 unnamed protein product [Rotaria magnacalcarata]